MNRLEENLQKLFEKYRFTEPIPGEVQKRALDSIKKNITTILRESGDYSFIFGGVLSIYLKGKRLGVTLSFLQSKIILAMTALITVSIISAAAFVLVKQVSTGKTEQLQFRERQIEEKAEMKDNTEKRNIDERKSIFSDTIQSIREPEVGINLFSGADRGLTEKATNSILDILKSHIGPGKVTLLEGKTRPGVKRIVSGSIRKLGNRYYFTSKVIHVKTGKIEYALSENIDGPEEIDLVLSKTAEKIACHITKCE
jgi:hypothetical protein